MSSKKEICAVATAAVKEYCSAYRSDETPDTMIYPRGDFSCLDRYVEFKVMELLSPWIPITPETMPESGKLMYVTWKNDCKKRMVVVGHYLERWKEESDCEDGANDEYSDQDDKYYIKQGWYEQQVNWGDWSSIHITDGTPDFYQPIVMPEKK